MRPGVTSRTRKKQVCPCLNLRTAPTCSCVFVCVVLCRVSHTLTHKECQQSEWADARWKYCNIITEAIRLPTPIPAKGNLGKWPLSRDTRLAIAQQLQHVKLIPTGEDKHQRRRTQGNQAILPYLPYIDATSIDPAGHTHKGTSYGSRTSERKRRNKT